MTKASTGPRIDLVPLDQARGELAEILSSALTVNGKPLNLFAALAHHPKLLKRFNLMGGLLLNKGLLPVREREIVVLRIGWKARSEYEFGQHTLIGLQCGLTQREIEALTRSPREHPWSRSDLALIAMADELSDQNTVTDSTWLALCERWSAAQLVELLVLAGFYRLVSGFLNGAQVPLDENVPGFPAADSPATVDASRRDAVARMNLTLRSAANGDRAAVQRLVYGVLGEYGLAADPDGTDTDLRDIEGEYIERGGIFDVLVTEAGEIVGSVGLHPLAPRICELRKMYLAPAVRGAGWGRRLLEHALSRARILGFSRVELETASVLKEAIRLYEQHGFRSVPAAHLARRCDSRFALDIG